MRGLIFALILLQACGARAPRLSPRDARLPTEAARWLADAEDQVEIARARLDSAETALTETHRYADELQQRVRALGVLASPADAVSDSRITLRNLELKAARDALDLAEARLVLTRAETAMRHDIGVYELEPLVAEVEARKSRSADAERQVEEQLGHVETTSDRLWKSYSQWLSSGGASNALWDLDGRR